MGTPLETAFKHFDSDSNGNVTAKELLEGVRDLGQFHDITLHEAQKFVDSFAKGTGMSKQAFMDFVR